MKHYPPTPNKAFISSLPTTFFWHQSFPKNQLWHCSECVSIFIQFQMGQHLESCSVNQVLTDVSIILFLISSLSSCQYWAISFSLCFCLLMQWLLPWFPLLIQKHPFFFLTAKPGEGQPQGHRNHHVVHFISALLPFSQQITQTPVNHCILLLPGALVEFSIWSRQKWRCLLQCDINYANKCDHTVKG